VRVPWTRDDAETAIHGLGLEQRQALAVELVRIATPFWELDRGLLDLDLMAVDQTLATAQKTQDMILVEQVRHALIELPALADDDEPTGLTWFAFRAAVAHIYAADALTTAPQDGVRNAFLAVEDILDAAESSLGRGDLLPLLYALVTDEDGASKRLSLAVPEVVHELRTDQTG
jgi:hypothetical protein